MIGTGILTGTDRIASMALILTIAPGDMAIHTTHGIHPGITPDIIHTTHHGITTTITLTVITEGIPGMEQNTATIIIMDMSIEV